MTIETPEAFGPAPRHATVGVRVGEGAGAVMVGGGAPIVVQSMTNTDTADIEATARQVAALARAGSEMVRITVDRDEAAAAVPHIRDRLRARGIVVPLVGDFHYIGHKLLDRPSRLRRGARQISHQSRQCRLQEQARRAVLDHRRDGDPAWQGGAHRRQLGFARPGIADRADGRERRQRGADRRARGDARGDGAARRCYRRRAPRRSASRATASSSRPRSRRVQDLIAVYRMLAQRSDYAIHLGLTEAGMGSKGIVASSAALGILLQEGIGDTIRVSLTPEPGGDRTLEVKVAQEILQTMGFRAFVPLVAACPGCGRTTSTVFQELAREIQDFLDESMPVWKTQYPGVEALNVAVMGCIVNGPGESKHADIGISLPGTGETPAAPVFIDGAKAMTLRGAGIAARVQDAGDGLHRAAIWRRAGGGGVEARVWRMSGEWSVESLRDFQRRRFERSMRAPERKRGNLSRLLLELYLFGADIFY